MVKQYHSGIDAVTQVWFGT